MRSHTIALLVIFGMVFALAFVPQQKAQAKTCYDQSKQPIPCPKSNYIQTQQAAKQAANSISFTNTPIPPTETLSPTPTNTSDPTSTNTALPLPTNTPTVQQSALVGQAVCPSPVAAAANNSGFTPPGSVNSSTFFPWLLGGGGLLGGILIGLLVPAVLKRSIGRERITKVYSNQDDGGSHYTYPELHAKDHDQLHESITDDPEKHTIQ